jgi:hypothetical protein
VGTKGAPPTVMELPQGPIAALETRNAPCWTGPRRDIRDHRADRRARRWAEAELAASRSGGHGKHRARRGSRPFRRALRGDWRPHGGRPSATMERGTHWGPIGRPFGWGAYAWQGVPTYWIWVPGSAVFDYPFADWRGPTGGWGNP